MGELMETGEAAIRDIKSLIESATPAVKTDFKCGVRAGQVILLFTITDLGGSKESDVRAFIERRLAQFFVDPARTKYKVHWAFEVVQGEEKWKEPGITRRIL